MIVLTGGAGFIGSNILAGLNATGRDEILVVDDLTDGRKYRNLIGSNYYDYMHYDDFLKQISHNVPFSQSIDVIIHQGACSVTTEWDGRYMMKNNYSYSKVLLHYCADHSIPFIYASSAAIYGGNKDFQESAQEQEPLNIYGYSKWAFDQYVTRLLPDLKNQVVGLRYFNVYGPGESHKGDMASVAYHLMRQLQSGGSIKLFGAGEGCDAGEHRRDFVYVDDIVKLVLWLLEKDDVRGIFNVGTGVSRSFNELANILIKNHGSGRTKYIPFPENLMGCYQSFTEADLTLLREAGYTEGWMSLEEGIKQYLQISA